MKIGILTQPLCNNYGGTLQNYVLQTVLKRMGHGVTTLNYPVEVCSYDSQMRYMLSCCRRILRKLSGDPSIVYISLKEESRKAVELAHLEKAFMDKHMHIVPIKSPITFDAVKDMPFDAFVVGSDQVWRPRYADKNLGNMFLDFTKGMNVKRVAYATSLGTDVWEYTPEQTKNCAELVKQFDAISVREASGVKLCKENLGVEPKHMLDPTLLLTKEDYLSVCSGNEHPNGGYIAVYTLDYTKQKMAFLNAVSKELNTPLHLIGRFTKAGFPSIESWLEGIANAKYVITDSFHGTVFSTIFERQFVTLGNAARGNSRFDSFFTTLGLSADRQCSDVASVIKMLQQPIDYTKINAIKAEKQKEAIEFLKSSL